ncbi:MAG: cytochrome c-type biogenesis protein CcmH [Polyangiaceae bacterium]
MKRPTMLARLLGGLALALVLVVSSAAAATNEDRATAIAEQLESPFCPGRTIAACTSPAAADWRREIQGWVDQGVASEEIRARLSERAGRDLRFVPQQDAFYSGIALGAVASILALVVLRQRARRWASAGAKEEVPPLALSSEEDAELDARLDAELAAGD